MIQRFRARGYQHKTIFRAHKKAKCLSREQWLTPKQKEQQNSDQVYFVTQYSDHVNTNKHIVKRNWDILTSGCALREALPDFPTIRFRRAPTLNDILVKESSPLCITEHLAFH